MPQKRQLDYDEIVRLRDEEGQTFAAIGERMGSGQGAIYRAYGRAKGTYSEAKDGKPKTEGTPQRTPERTRGAEEEGTRDVHARTREKTPEPVPQQPSECTEGTRERTRGTSEEWEEVKEMLAWWKERQEAYTRRTRQGTRERTPEGTRPRVPQTFRLRGELLEALKEYAAREGISVGEAVNQVLEVGLEALG